MNKTKNAKLNAKLFGKLGVNDNEELVTNEELGTNMSQIAEDFIDLEDRLFALEHRFSHMLNALEKMTTVLHALVDGIYGPKTKTND